MISVGTVGCQPITPSPLISPTSIADLPTTIKVGNWKVSVLEAYFWRDWMPIVEHPGSDGGSPLYAKIQIHLSNPRSKDIRLNFTSVVHDHGNRTYRIVFQVLPNQHKVVWDGSLKAGEDRVVELITYEGPYLPVSSEILTAIVFTDQD